MLLGLPPATRSDNTQNHHPSVVMENGVSEKPIGEERGLPSESR